MRLTSESFEHESPFTPRCAFCVPDADNHGALGQNGNPALSWSNEPEGTESFVQLCHDPDVPAKPDNVNQEGKKLPKRPRRADFFHWLQADTADGAVDVQAGEFSYEVTPRWKGDPSRPRGTREGVNDCTRLLEGDEEMGGSYFGYDHPCAPWDDSVVHHNHINLYAIRPERCPAGGKFTGTDVLGAIPGHVPGETRVTGTCTLNPDVPA